MPPAAHNFPRRGRAPRASGAGRASRPALPEPPAPAALPAPRPQPSAFRKDLLLGGLVGASMLVITGIYALTLRYQDFGARQENAPRWSVLSEGVETRIAPLKTVLADAKDALSSVTQASKTQKAAALALKAKLEAGTVPEATSTPETNPEPKRKRPDTL